MNQTTCDNSESSTSANKNSPNFLERNSVKAFAVVQSIMMVGSMQAQSESTRSSSSETNPTTKLSDVVVEDSAAPKASSPKFTQPLRDTPQTITIIPAEVYTQQGATNLSEVLRNTPGITFAAGEGGNVASGDSFYMRGFDSSNSIFIDGVRDTGAYNRDIYNSEQVEIAKGPADNGRGGTSGYINLATKSPTLTRAVTAQAVLGSADQKRATLDVNQPLSSSPIAGTSLRLNLLWQDSGVPGRDHVEKKSFGVAPSLALGLGTPTRLIFTGSYDKQENLPDSGLPIAAMPGAVPTTPPTGPVNQENFYGLANADFDNIERTSLGAKIEHDINPDLTLNNQLRYIETDRDALTSYMQNSAAAAYNPATGIVTPRRIHNQAHNEIISNQTNLTAKLETGDLRHDLSAGLELSREKQRTPAWTAVNGPTTSIYTPDAHRPATEAQTPFRNGGGAQSKATTDTAALYLGDTLHLSEHWLVNANARWERYNIDYNIVDAAGLTTPLSHSDKLLSWKAGVVFKPTTAGSLYAAYGNSYTPAGTDFVLSTAVNNANNSRFSPQENRNYEIGAKWDFFDSRLSTSLALYRSENLNVVSQDSATLQYTQDASNRNDGVEVGVSGKITGNWLVYGGVAWMDAEFETPATSTTSSNSGAGLRFTPRLSGNLWTAYTLFRGFNLGLGAQYTNSVVRSTSNAQAAASATALPSIPPYWLFSASATYDINKNFTLRLNVDNLVDEDTYRLNNNGGRYYPGTPRSFKLTATVKY